MPPAVARRSLSCAFLILAGCVQDERAQAPERPLFASYEDAHGRVWVATHAVEYAAWEAEPPYQVDELAEALAPPDPRTVSDDEWAAIWRPISEFGGWEYELTEESLHDYGTALRASAVQRAESPGEFEETPGSGPPSDVAEISEAVAEQPGVGQQAMNKTIVGKNDDRVAINNFRNVWPYSMHGAMTTVDGGRCTAFKVINQETAGTAAHCLHNGSKWLKRSDIIFHDGSRGTVNRDCYARTVGSGWTTGVKWAQEDYGVLAFSDVNGMAWCTRSTYNLGWFGTKYVGYTNIITGYLSGYPASDVLPPGVPQVWPTLVFHERGGAEVGTVRPKVLLYDNDGEGGQSGSPFVTRPFYRDANGRYVWPNDKQVVRAIHKGDVFEDWNQGREFDGDIVDFFRATGGSPQGTPRPPGPIPPDPPCSGVNCQAF